MAIDTDQDTRQALSPSELAEQDQQRMGMGRTAQQDAEVDRLEKDFNYTPETDGDKGKSGGRFKKVKGFFKKHKKLMWFAGPTAGFGLIGIMFVLFMLSSMMLPHFIENTMAQRFAHSARAYRMANNQLLSKKLAQQAVPSTKTRVLDKIKSAKSTVMLEKWRPGAIVNNLQATGQLDFEYEPRGGLAQLRYGSKLTAIKLKGQRIPVDELKKWATPFSGRGDANTLSSVRLAAEMDDVLGKVYGTSTTQQILRTAVGAEILDRLGYRKFYAWSNKARDYKGVEQRQADRMLIREMNKTAVGKGVVGKPSVPANEKAVDEVREANAKALADDALTTEMVQKGGAASSVLKTLHDKTQSQFIDTAIKAVSSGGAIAMTACAIVDGSVQSSAPIMDANAESASRQFMMLASMADQQKAGETASEAVGAINRKINGDGSLARANSLGSPQAAKPSETNSPLAGAAGDFSILNVAFAKLGGDPENGTIGGANAACKVVGSYQFAIGAAGIELIIGFITGGTSKVATQGVTKAATIYLANFTRSLATKRTAQKLIIQGGAVGGATLLARSIVANYSNQYYNGTSNNLALAEEGIAGAEVLNGEVSRTLAGATMTGPEAEETFNASKKENAEALSAMGPFERYLAISNPQSLLTHVGYTVMGSTNTPMMANLLTSASKIFNPLAVMGVFGKLSPSVAAAGDTNPSSYTKTTFGWTEKELKLIQTHRSYFDIDENECILDGGTYRGDECEGGDGAKRKEIGDKYGKCWSDSVGTLLASGAISRFDDGTPKPNEGLCSPQNLGVSNPEYGDLVFRWRVSKLVNAVAQVGSEISNPTTSTVSAKQATGAGGGALVWPIETSASITDCFGDQSSPRPFKHRGIDLAGPSGTKIFAAADGVVTRAGTSSGYGNHFVIIKHDNGLSTSYGHMKSMTVKVGDDVTAGKQIGVQGNEGDSSGEHLHFNVFPGSYRGSDDANVNPLKHLTIPSGVSNPHKCTAEGK